MACTCVNERGFSFSSFSFAARLDATVSMHYFRRRKKCSFHTVMAVFVNHGLVLTSKILLSLFTNRL